LQRVSVFVQDATRTRAPFFSTDTPLGLEDPKGNKAKTTTSSLSIAESGTVLDVDVRLDITHTRDSDLSAVLVAPDGTEVLLFANLGGSGDNYSLTLFDDQADNLITDGAAPFQGTFQPVGNLSDFNGLELNGTWQLRISDNSKGDTGTLNSWTLIARHELPPPPLPTISIDDVQLAEGNAGTTSFVFTVTRGGDTSAAVSVNYATADATATAPADYTATSGTLTFLADETTKTVTVSVNGDTLDEGNETFSVNLSAATGGATISDAQGVGTIQNDGKRADQKRTGSNEPPIP